MKRPVYACLNMAVIAVGLALASPANAANVFVEVIDFGEVGCDATYRTTVDARPGETNTVTMRNTEGVTLPIQGNDGCGGGPIVVPPQVQVADATAPLFPLRDQGCEYAGAPVQNRLVSCNRSDHVGAFLKDGDDRLVVETMRAVVNAGPGDDHVEVLSIAADRVRCGDGVDTVVAGPGDFVDLDCEQVFRLG